MNTGIVFLLGLFFLILSLVASMFFSHAASMNGYSERRRRARQDVILARTLRDKRRELCAVDIPANAPLAHVGDLAVFPDGSLAACKRRSPNDKEYRLGNGHVMVLGQHAKADYLRGPFYPGRE